MQMKIWIKRVIKGLAVFLPIVALFLVLQRYVYTNYTNDKYRLNGFYKETDNTLDVVFLGASDVYAGFSSAYAYQLYGFTSYPFATQGTPINMYESQLKEVLKTQTPKLIVVEVNGALYGDDSVMQEEKRLRWYLDNIPMSINKFQTINEFVPLKERISYYFPLFRYHSLDEPNKEGMMQLLEDDIRGYTLSKGYKTQYLYNDTTDIIDVSEDFSLCELEKGQEACLISFLEYCQEHEIDNILFVRFPHCVTSESYESYQRAETVGEIVNEYGYDYINFDRQFDAIGLDSHVDFYNYGHLNLNGTIKFTQYFGDILQNEYGIGPTPLSQEETAKWEEGVQYWEDEVKHFQSEILEIESGVSYDVM